MLVQDISTNEINLQNKSRETKSAGTVSTINISAINQLQLIIDRKNDADLQQLTKILTQILDYPDTSKTELHSQAMKLGNFDLQNQPPVSKARLDTSSEMLNSAEKSDFCTCCGFKKQQTEISIMTPLDKIKNMGLSNYLFFATFKNLSLLLAIMTIIYSVYAIITNIIASAALSAGAVDYITISLGSKETNNTAQNRLYYFISCWLGVATLIIWILAIIGIKYHEAKDSKQYDDDTISCSDYSIVIEGMPRNVNKAELQKQLNQYFQNSIKNNSRLPAVWKEPLVIAKINTGTPFYLNVDELKEEESVQIQKELAEIKVELKKWILERQSSQTFSVSKNDRDALYQKYKKLSERKQAKNLQMALKIEKLLKGESGEELNSVFITFQSSNNKTVLSFIHESGILSKLRALCNSEHQRFSYTQDGKTYDLTIARAPEPEDIIWGNIGHHNCAYYLRKLFTFTVTAVLLGISFGIVYGLTKAQQANDDNRLISIAISLTISIVNAIIGQVIRYLTLYQKDYTATFREASLAIKSIVAQMINTIVIPVISAYYIKYNVYEATGLVDNVFMLGVSSIFVPPILIMIDPYNLFMKIVRCVKSRPKNKLEQTQKEHNCLHEGIQFQVGYHYIYTANVFIFVCFFVSLQPILSLFGMVGYFLMFWAQKYCMFNRYRRPVPGTDFVNNAVYRIILIGPFIYSLGSLTWSNFSPKGFPAQALLPNLVAVGISLLLYIIPYNTIIMGSCFSDEYSKSKKYDDERIIFPSQYDRLNPTTQKEAMEEYQKYLERKMIELKNMSQEKQIEYAKKMAFNAQRGQMAQRSANPVMMGSVMPAMQPYMFPQPMPMMMYQPAQMMMPGFSPFASGFMMPQMQMQQMQRGYAPQPQIRYQQAPPPQAYQQPRQTFGPTQTIPLPIPMNPQNNMMPQQRQTFGPPQIIPSTVPMNTQNSMMPQPQQFANPSNPQNGFVAAPFVQQFNSPQTMNNMMNMLNPTSTFGLQNLAPHQNNRRK